jgi:Na+/proline symporter
MTPTLAALLAYLLLQLGIGVWVSRRIATESDYLVAGRRLGYGLATFSMFATWFGAETIVGSAGTTYREGVSIASAEPFGYGLCLILMGLVFAVPLWRRRLTTLADLFRQRYSVGVERLAAAILIPSSILWAAAQVRAFGTVISTAAPALDVERGIAVAAGFTILYTAFGGLLVDAITDLIQGVLLVLGLVIVGAAVLDAAGGMAGVAATLDAAARGARARGGRRRGAGVAGRGGGVGDPRVRLGDRDGARGARRRHAHGGGGAPLGARRGRAVPDRGADPGVRRAGGRRARHGPGRPEALIPTIAQRLLPTFAYAVFAGGLISAILSTVDSTLLVASGCSRTTSSSRCSA